MKINSQTEVMFAQAVALAQSGRLKSTIHCGGDEIFIINMDNTIIIRYESPQTFEEPFSFFANDYESSNITVVNGQMVFTTVKEGAKRQKTCPAPQTTFENVQELWKKRFKKKPKGFFTIDATQLSFLEDDLSHVELEKTEEMGLVMRQRDIYSGANIEITKDSAQGALFEDDTCENFEAIGVRTSDLQGLFTFVDSLSFYFKKEWNYLYFESRTGELSGILARCLYDELGTLGEA